MILMLVFGMVWGAINYLRGRGFLPHGRVLAPMLWGLTGGLLAAGMGIGMADVSWVMWIAFLGTLFWSMFGWGLYFAAYTGLWQEHEHEIGFIDAIGLKLVPFVSPLDIDTNRLRGTICMGLRGLFILPMFVALAFYFHNMFLVVFGLVGFLQGPIYGAMRFLSNVSAGSKYAEPLTMFAIGMATGGAVWLVSPL